MDTIRTYLHDYLNYNVLSDEFYTYIAEWDNWYKGDVKSFHHYTQYNGSQLVSRKLYSLGMAKKVCEDHANLQLNEKLTISTGNNQFDEVLETVLNDNNFRLRANQLIELSYALGTGALVEYKDADGRVIIDYIRAPMITPLSSDNGDITEAAFGSNKNIKGQDAYYINIHTKTADGYQIENKVVAKDKFGIKVIAIEEIQQMTYSVLPRFQIITPNIVNNIDYDSAMGISVYANAIDQLKAVDLAYDSYVNEYVLGKKRIIVPYSMVQIMKDAEGIGTPIFDPNDIVFYGLPSEAVDTIHEINMTIRNEEHDAGIERFLSLLSDKCGLGKQRYKLESGSAKTATEVISEQSELYQNMKKNRLSIDSALKSMVMSIAEMTGFDPYTLEIKIDYDDSIITDKETERSRMMQFVSTGKYPFWRYLVNYENYTEDEAKAIEAEGKASTSFNFGA